MKGAAAMLSVCSALYCTSTVWIVQKGKKYPGITFHTSWEACAAVPKQSEWVRGLKALEGFNRRSCKIAVMLPVLVELRRQCQTQADNLLDSFRALQCPAFLISCLTFSYVTSFIMLKPSFVMHWHLLCVSLMQLLKNWNKPCSLCITGLKI